MDENNWLTQYEINNAIANALKLLNNQLMLLFIWNVVLTIAFIIITIVELGK